MTPTEQDNELREAILLEFKNVHRLAPADYTENCTNIVMQLITADRKRVALEEREKARKFYAKRKPQFTKTWVADVLGISRPTLDKWIANPEQFTIGAVKKLAELKAQQEGVK